LFKNRILLALCLSSAATLSAGVLPPVCVNSTGIYLSGTCGTGGTVTSFGVNYNGYDVNNNTTYIIPGLSAAATYSNFVFDATANTIAFNVSVTNTSTIAGGSRLNSLGFDTQPVPTSGTISNQSVGNPYDTVNIGPLNVNGLTGIDFCFTGGNNCNAGNSGLGNGQSASFTATLNFADITSSSTFLLTQFVDRYSAFTYQVPGGPLLSSATGVAVVPEPTTYAFLLSIFMSGVVLYRKRRPAQE